MDRKLELNEFENVIHQKYCCYGPPKNNVFEYFEQFDINKDGSWDVSGVVLLLSVF
jgi:hypothetical protein